MEVGWFALKETLQKMIETTKQSKGHDLIFDKLMVRVLEELVSRHSWEEKSIETLRLIQLNALEDRLVHDKHQWDASVQFMEQVLREKFNEAKDRVYQMVGPGFYEQWLYWKYRSPEQNIKCAIKSELEAMLFRQPETFFRVSSESIAMEYWSIRHRSLTDIEITFSYFI